jgi:tetratricopeptide repeat protein 30
LVRFEAAAQNLKEMDEPFSAELQYNIALVHFELCQYANAVACLDSILSNAYHQYPQLTQHHSEQTTSDILRKTSLIEALNLKSAVLYLQEHYTDA